MYLILSIIGIICFATGVGLMFYDLVLDMKDGQQRDLKKTCSLLRLILVLICLGNVVISIARLIK